MTTLLPVPDFTRFVEHVSSLVTDLERLNPPHSSEEWYLLNHVRTLHKNASSSSSAHEIANSIKSLMRFTVDSLEWDGPLKKRVDHLLELHGAMLARERH